VFTRAAATSLSDAMDRSLSRGFSRMLSIRTALKPTELLRVRGTGESLLKSPNGVA
jgi:hypothetical protein